MKIKPELQEMFNTYTNLEDSTNDSGMPSEYFQAIIDAANATGEALDAGKSPEEALEALKGRELTGYMAGEAVSIVSHFNPRGGELKSPWNKRWGGTGEESGTINPAIITLKT